MKTIRIEALDKQSVDKAIMELRAVKKEWERKAKLAEEEVAKVLAELISNNLSAIPYTDDLIDLKTHQEVPEKDIIASYAKGNTVYVESLTEKSEVAFVEFGAGIYHAGTGNPLSEAVQFNTEIGSYGKGHGLQPYWFVAHNLISRGTPAYMPIYNAIQDLKPMIPAIVRGIFL